MSQTFVIPSQSEETILSPYTIKILKMTYPEIEFATIYGIVMSVEGLNTHVSSDIPQTYSLVTTATYELVAVWLELD